MKICKAMFHNVKHCIIFCKPMFITYSIVLTHNKRPVLIRHKFISIRLHVIYSLYNRQVQCNSRTKLTYCQ